MTTIRFDFNRRFQKSDPTQFKFEGIELIRRVQEWVKKWPDQAHLISCDDWSACGSYILVLENEGGNPLWGGITAFVIPQYGKPVEFDMYREEIEAAVKTLQAILDKNPPSALELQQSIRGRNL